MAARHWPELVVPPPGFTFRQFLDANAGRAPVFVVNRVPWLQTLEERFDQEAGSDDSWGANLPSGDELASEVERFLRDQRPDI